MAPRGLGPGRSRSAPDLSQSAGAGAYVHVVCICRMHVSKETSKYQLTFLEVEIFMSQYEYLNVLRMEYRK